MRRYSQRTGLTTLSEINITPLLDLAFVLLIIFMITTPLLENSVNLVIPSSGAANAPVNPPQVQTISIDRTKRFALNNEGDRTGHARLRDCAELKQANPDVAVVIRPDRELAGAKIDRLDGRAAARGDHKSRHRDQSRIEVAMTRDARFWRNVTIIALLHIALLIGFSALEPRTEEGDHEQYRMDERWRRG